MAADLARGHFPEGTQSIGPEELKREWPNDLNEVVYVDHFGNAITGVRAHTVSDGARMRVGEQELSWARTFSEVEPGEAFWYENANGLVEIAVNQGRADDALGLGVGSPVQLLT
jgi:hypothetical protein